MSSRRSFFQKAGLAALSGLLAQCTNKRGVSHTQSPNIVLIVADDMGFSDIGCYGGAIETPVLDRLAENGLRYTQFYNTARRCPTRAGLLTGLYQHQAAMRYMTYDTGIPGYRGDLNRNCVTIAEVLQSGGYHTYMSGKWHVTAHYGHWIGDSEYSSKHNWPLQRGFDRFYGIIDGTSNYFQPFSLVEDNEPIPLDMDEKYYLTDAITDHPVRCIDENPPDKRFFNYVAYTAPHWPLHAFPDDIDKYRGRFDERWDTLREKQFERMARMGVIDPAWGLADRDSGARPFDEESNKEYRLRCMEVYAAMIDRMDWNIGRIVDALERTGKLENTVIFFLSDNGGQDGELGRNIGEKRFTPLAARDCRPMRPGNDPSVMPGPKDTYQSYGSGWATLSNTPFKKFKMWTYEGGIAAPLIVHWPAGIGARGELRGQVGHILDLMPTCRELAGAPYPPEREGERSLPPEVVSLVRTFRDEPIERDALFWEHGGHRAVRRGKWKLAAARNSDWELFDMEVDRTERNNLAETHPDTVAELESLYGAWAKRCGVKQWNEMAAANSASSKRQDDITREYRKKRQRM